LNDEAIISLFASLLVGGWLKEKYLPQIQQAFAMGRSGAVTALQPEFGMATSSRLVNCVVEGDKSKVLECVKSLRFSLALRGLLRRPIRGFVAIVRHYAGELAFRYSPRSLKTVRILGWKGCDKKGIIEALMPMLQSFAVAVERRNLGVQVSSASPSSKINTDTDSGNKTSGVSIVLMVKVALWLLREWSRQLSERKNPTFHICESDSYDLLIDPASCNRRIPKWFAQITSSLFSSNALWILLDASAELVQSQNPEAPRSDICRQLEAYRSFVKAKTQYAILDAGQSNARVTEEAYIVIVDYLAQRVNQQLAVRFQCNCLNSI
jgi:hypothetical protein